MSRMLKVLLFLCVAAASTAAASSKKNPEIERAVKAELVGRSFTTKILVGGVIPCPQSGRNDAIKPVDTELSPDGSIRYYARANCFYQPTPGVLDLGVFFDATRGYVAASFSTEIPPGSSVGIQGVDFKEDRVEVRLIANGNNTAQGSGKIKYMLGSSYLTWSADQLMEVIARGIAIPAYEKLSQVKTEFELLRGNLQQAESKYNSAGADNAAKLADAIALRQVLEKLQTNRATFMALGKSDPDSGVYSKKLSSLLPEIAKLTAEARQRRVAHVRDQLKAQLPQLSEIQRQVRQKPPSSMAESQQRSDSLTQYSTLLGERQKLLDELQSENEAPAPEDVKLMNESKVEIETGHKALEQGHQQLELSDLTSQYGQLTKKHAQLLDAYSRAFGTSKERPALQDLIAVLGQMVANRDRAAGLGDKTAPAQLIKCRAEAEKYKRK